MSDLRTRLIQKAKAKRALDIKLEALRLEGSLIEFYKAAWPVIDPAPYQHNWHLEAIADHLEAVARGQIRKLCINLPPRHSKTMICSVAFNAWVWAQEPDERYPLMGPGARFMCLSYGDNLAMDNSVLTRRLIQSDWYQARWGHRVKPMADQDAKNKFDTSAGGARISGSFQGTVTGRGAGIRVYDDPHKMDEVESKKTREKVLRVYETTLRSRITDPRISAEVLVAQRGHQDDLSSMFLDDPETVHLNLPAEYDPARHCTTVLGWEDPRTKTGELLWKDRFGPRELAPYKSKPYEWAAQWQQAPIPRGGGLIKEQWWQVHEVQKQPSGGFKFVPEFTPDFVLASLDTAFTENEQNSASAMTVWAVHTDQKTKQRKILLVDGWEKHLEMHGETVERRADESEASWMRRAMPKWGLVEWVNYTCKRRRVNRLIIENKSRGHDVNNELKRVFGDRDFGIRMIEPKGGDKYARGHAVVDLFTDDMIYAPAEITDEGNVRWLDWADTAIRNICAFPNGTQDDTYDTMTMALRHLREVGLATRRDETAAEDNYRAQHKSQRTILYPA